MIQLLAYRGMAHQSWRINLGDAIQTLAISRLLPGPFDYIYRDAIRTESLAPFVLNGYLCDEAPGAQPNAFFCGIHIAHRHEQQIRWIRSSRYPVGARDPWTLHYLHQRGIEAQMIGCATLTLPFYEGPRLGRYAIDTAGDGTCQWLSQDFVNLSWNEQLAMAEARLDAIRKAELVITNRLHIALPCLAYGTPLIVRRSSNEPNRLTLLEALGIEFDKMQLLDVTSHARRFKSFLYAGLARIFGQSPD